MLWNVADRKPSAVLADSKEQGVEGAVAFSPDGRLVAGNDHDDRTVWLWETPSKTP
ncbi:hypothetical protein ACFC09_08275 [Streptomyces sp. NPDC056161]|uniref:hypothetical protein n=1 Tax=Streptomyces sp. NPDC056161 TaxID=3345732 RepID=UPI0035DDB81B